ncbi:MAG: hypothetical protein EBR02_07785, partial [Alphaproteobacteria bacterium]|nr:hypothetical protein [Alphaproteobacteria bacterium]
MADEENQIPPYSDPAIESSDDFPPTQEQAEEYNAEENIDEEISMTHSSPGMSNGPGKVIAFGAILLVVAGYVLFSLFSGKPKPADPIGARPGPAINSTGGEKLPPPPPVSSNIGGGTSLAV